MPLKTKLTKKEIETLNGLEDSQRSELLSLFSEAEAASEEAERLRKAQPADSQIVVEKTDHDALKKAVEERDGKLAELQAKLDGLSIDVPADDFLSVFSPIIEFFKPRA